MAEKKKRISSEHCQLFHEESKHERSEDETRHCRALRVQERDRKLEDGESANDTKSEVIVHELMPIAVSFDAVMKGIGKILFGTTIRESNLIYFVNPTLLWSANWSWIETGLAESMVIVNRQ